MTTEPISPEPSREEVDRMTGPVLLEFGAEWCEFCQALRPELAKLLTGFPEIKHIRIEDGKGKPLGRSFGVRLWPNLVLMRDGKAIAQLARPTVAEVRKELVSLRAPAS